jgi:hypothetical protein
MRHIIAMQTTGFTSTYVLAMSILGSQVTVATRVMQCVSSLLLITRSLDSSLSHTSCHNVTTRYISSDILHTDT